MNKIATILLVIWCSGATYSQDKWTGSFMPDDLRKVVLMQPTGNIIDNLPEMKILNDTSEPYRQTMSNIHNSFVSEFLDLYFIAQIYLMNINKSDSIEPAYLALTENQGGFAKFGFSKLENGIHTAKAQTPYIDITVGQATAPLDKLMSFTQLYPHEMGHVFLHMLSPEDSNSNNAKNVDMHYFSIITDYSTAFNEGFAEHIENLSRTLEKNQEIKAGIFADIEKIEKSSKQSIKGFERDFIYPFRLAYYKASMLIWYQKFENYKRYAHAFSGDVRYKNMIMASLKTEDQLTFRNAGIVLNKHEVRNLVQLCATEGAVSSFFTHLSTSDLQNHYLDPAFYTPFFYNVDGGLPKSPENIFSPLQNQFIKYFYVLHQYVVINNSPRSQLTDFVDGYIQTFPSEGNTLKAIFMESLGVEYSNEIPPPIWLSVKNYSHRLLLFDLFDAITIPVYTFDLNAAEVEDLLTIEGVPLSAAQKIVEHREVNGYFTNLEQLHGIPGISNDIINEILSAKWGSDNLEETLGDFESGLNIGKLILSPIKHLFLRLTAYFLLVIGSLYFFLVRDKKATAKGVLWLFARYFLLWIFFVSMGLFFVISGIENPYYFVLFLVILSGFIAALIYRKRRLELRRSLIFIGLMNLLILISIV